MAEDDPVAAVKKYHASDRLAAVHIKDWKPDYGRWSHRYAHGFCLPGEGIVPIEKVMNTLDEIGFGGWVILEQDHFDASREETALGMCILGGQVGWEVFSLFFPERRADCLRWRSESSLRVRFRSLRPVNA